MLTLVLLALGAEPARVTAGFAADLRCQYCGTGDESEGRDIDSRLGSLFASWREGSLRVSLGLRLESVEAHESYGARTPQTIEHAASILVSYDPGPFAFGLGVQHQRESILLWDASFGLPVLSLRAGWEDGLNSYLSFGDFGSFSESAGTIQMGLAFRLPARVRWYGGLSAELAPAIGYEAGAEVDVAAGFGVGARAAVSSPVSSEFRYAGFGVTWSGSGPAGFSLLAPQRDGGNAR